METIKSLFDRTRDIYRTIEKVITYNASQEHRLKAEISEYIVTESIEEQLEKLLMKMQAAMEMGGEHEIGVWVSGFYGSGKSSFTKYLGLALDSRAQIDGIPFLQYLQDRLHKPQTKALLAAVAKRFPAAVVFLDLASEMLAGATMEDVSTVLYYKVLQWAGYSRNLKVAALERRLQKDGRYEEFKQRILDELGVEWADVQNDPLVVDSIVPEIAHQMYPQLFKTPTAFTTETSDYVLFENERVQEMIEIIREATGKQYIIFIIDEVGQYVGSRQNLILNLDGLAKNLKNIGGGKVWIIGTAQQTLTEDDPRAALNSPELYKLKDRFPIQIDLESSDIKKICYRRLLGKSPEGETRLGNLFDQYGQSLRHHTKLQDAKYYGSDFDRETFVNLYPFLPAHFDILLHLLGALAKSTGGIGLRSAIKVIQDILIEGADGRSPVAEQPVGWLATTVTLYDALEKDIRRAFPSVHRAVEKVRIRFPDSMLHQEIAKTVAVLQILGNLPVTVQNVASLMHPGISAPSRKDEIEKAVSELVNDPLVPFGEQDGNLCFFSEKLIDIEQERAQIPLRSAETRRIFNEALREAFSPLPSTRLNGALAVTTGLKVQNGSSVASLAGERETIQTVVEFVAPGDYETARTRLVDESRHKSSRNIIYLVARTVPEIEEKVAEIYRCQEICRRYRNEPDQEIKEYCIAQADRAAKIAGELQQILKHCLARGSFVFRGQTTAVESLDQDVLEAGKKYLAEVAAQVFERFAEAPVRVETAVAEQFLRAGNLTAVTSKIDPLGLVQITGGKPSIKTDHKALVSIRDYLDRNGTVEGKRLIDYFTGAPFGWSPDTLRYLVAALLVAGEIKLKVSGREVTVNGQQAIDALKTNNTFKSVGVALREDRPSLEVLARAAERLTELVGDLVVPLEDEISKTAAKHLPRFQSRFAPLEGKLSSLGLPGAERIRSLNQEIADILLTDASDAPQRLGGEESSLYNALRWAGDVDRVLKQGLEETIRNLQLHRREIQSMPHTDVPGRLREELAEELDHLAQRLGKDDFYKHAADLNTVLTTIKARTRDAAVSMAEAQKNTIRAGEEDLRRMPEWGELTQEEQANVLAQLEALIIEASDDLQGLKQLISQEFVIHSRLRELKERIVRQGHQRRLRRIEEEKEKAKQEGKTKITRSVRLPSIVTSADQLDALIRQLQELKNELALYKEIEVTIKIED
ncbi:MAG: BREX system P-loop protein BrxC [Firmicutes bacterium]|nr:BREX system P-loop protein BrxC [Bacillota bacterium]